VLNPYSNVNNSSLPLSTSSLWEEKNKRGYVLRILAPQLVLGTQVWSAAPSGETSHTKWELSQRSRAKSEYGTSRTERGS